jgi:hypothetical protein
MSDHLANLIAAQEAHAAERARFRAWCEAEIASANASAADASSTLSGNLRCVRAQERAFALSEAMMMMHSAVYHVTPLTESEQAEEAMRRG